MATITLYADGYRISGDDGTTYYLQPATDDSGDWHIVEYPAHGTPRHSVTEGLGPALAYAVTHGGVQNIVDLL